MYRRRSQSTEGGTYSGGRLRGARRLSVPYVSSLGCRVRKTEQKGTIKKRRDRPFWGASGYWVPWKGECVLCYTGVRSRCFSVDAVADTLKMGWLAAPAPSRQMGSFATRLSRLVEAEKRLGLLRWVWGDLRWRVCVVLVVYGRCRACAQVVRSGQVGSGRKTQEGRAGCMNGWEGDVCVCTYCTYAGVATWGRCARAQARGGGSGRQSIDQSRPTVVVEGRWKVGSSWMI